MVGKTVALHRTSNIALRCGLRFLQRLIKEYADKQGVTEQLKAENQLEWVGKMNNIRSRAVEIIDVELICV